MSSSRSNTSQATNQVDNRRVIGEGGVSAENSNVNYSVVNNSLDGEIINAVLGGAFDFGSEAFGFGPGVADRAFAFGDSSLNLVGDALYESLGFGRDAMTLVGNANADALAFADAQATRNAAMAYNVVGDAMASNEAIMGKALALGAGVLGQGFDLIGNTTNLVKDAYADAKGRGALTDKMIMAAIAAMAIVAFAAIKK